MNEPEGRVVAVCAGCSEPIIEGTGWRRLPNPDGGFLDYHHVERSEPSQQMTRDGQHFRRETIVVKTCTPKTGRKVAA